MLASSRGGGGGDAAPFRPAEVNAGGDTAYNPSPNLDTTAGCLEPLHPSRHTHGTHMPRTKLSAKMQRHTGMRDDGWVGTEGAVGEWGWGAGGAQNVLVFLIRFFQNLL